MKKEQNTITVKEAASSLGVSEMTVYRMLKAGKLNAVQALYEGRRQSFILMDEKWKNAISKKQNDAQKVSETAFMRLCVISARDAKKSAEEHADKAEAASRNAADKAEYARVQANDAKNASEDANRYYLATKAFAEDSVKFRAQAAEYASKAKEEAQSAAYCVIWCVCGTAISIAACIFSIFH